MRKKFKCFIIFICLLALLIPATAFAEESGDNETTQTGLLSIDNGNIYSGMTKTYSQGYVPVVSDGKANIVLPLIPQKDAKIKDNAIKVTPNLGDASTSPFVFSNIEQTVSLADNAINNEAGTTKSFLVNLTLSMVKDRTKGRYPVVLQVKYQKEDGTELNQSFTVYVTVKDGKAPASTTTTTEKPQPQPKLIIEEYSVSPDPAIAGQDFMLTATLKNTSEKRNVQNIKLTFKGETADLMPAENSYTMYIKSLAKGKTYDINFRMKVGLDAEPKPKKVIITVEYEDNKATAITATEEVLVQIKQPNRISFDQPNVPKSMNAGDTVPLTFNVFNMGKNKLYNVMCKLEAPGLIPDGSSFLGNMDAGASKQAELSLFVGTKDMSQTEEGQVTTGNDDANKYGPTSGIIHLTYEDEFGQQYNEDIKIETSINPPVIAPQKEEKKEEQPKASQWWISVAIAAGVIAALVVAIALVKKKQTGKAELDDAD